MAPTLLYLLKANVVLALFAAAYYGLLRGLTFFGLNRAYLVLAVLFAAVYPALPMPALLPAAGLAPLPVVTGSLAVAQSAGPAAPAAVVPWLLLAAVSYGVGVGALLLRLLGQLLSLAWVRARSRPAQALGQAVRVVPGVGGPFSFGRTIYLSAATLAETACLPAVLRHEQAHVRQWHTLDVLLVQTATALAWLNPAAWLLRRAVLDNLEYLADRAALQTGLNRRAYQYSLLRLAPSAVPAPALAFHFSLLTLKNRIAMLNQPISPTRQLGRYFLAAPLVMALALGYSSAHAQVVPTPEPAAKPLPTNMVCYVDGKLADKATVDKIDPANISFVQVLKPAQQKQVFGTTSDALAMVITTKANASVPAVLAFNKRIEEEVPMRPATPGQVESVETAKAYLTKNYPNAKLESILSLKEQPSHTKVIFTENGKRVSLVLDRNGQPVKQ
ncbi:MAG: M56 family metallopeptidase [Janthinobacterium lividum]